MFFRLLLLLACCFSSSVYAYWNTNWSYRTEVNLTSDQARTNYVVTLSISGSDLYSGYSWSNDGRDLRVIASDDSTQLSFYIKSWDASAKTASIAIKFPALAAGSNRFYLYYGNTSAATASNVSQVLQRGTLYRSRYSTLNPASWASAYAELSNTLTSGYGETLVADFTNVENSNLPGGSNTNFVAYITARFTTTGSGTFYFRFGADFGRGAELRVDGVTLETQWNDDLWWNKDWYNDNTSFGRTDGVLKGSIYLTGNTEHVIEILGSEGGNDGGMTLQVCSSTNCGTGSNDWRAFSTTNFSSIYAPAPATDSSINLTIGSTIVRGKEVGVTVTAPDYWYQNSSQSLSYQVKNNGTDSVSSLYLYVGLDTDLAVTSVSGSGWSCNYESSYNSSRYYGCNYSGSAVTSGNSFPVLVAQVVPGSSTDKIGYFSARMWPGDVNSSNDSVSDNRSYIQASSSLCSNSGSGLWISYYSYTTSVWSGGYVDSHSEFNSLISLLTANSPDGEQVIESIDGTGNPFGSNNYFMAIISGYLYIPSDGEWTFAIDGDDATEVLIDGEVVTYRYGPNSASGSAQNRVARIMQAGYHPIEYRVQNHGGDSGYYLYMGQGGTASAQLTKVSSTRFRQCDAVYDLRLTSDNAVESDPVNGTVNPKAIPGSWLQVSVTASNYGALTPDADSVTIVQAIPDNSRLYLNAGSPVTFTDGSGTLSSGLALSQITYSSGGNADSDFTYQPLTSLDADGANLNVRYMKLTFSGTMNGANGTVIPQFSYQFRVILQ